MKTALDKHGGRDVGQQVFIWRWRIYRMAIEEMWEDVYGKMGWKNGDGLGKYQQGKTTNLRAYRCSNNLGVRETTDLHGDS